jgi:hypothetical protein
VRLRTHDICIAGLYDRTLLAVRTKSTSDPRRLFRAPARLNRPVELSARRPEPVGAVSGRLVAAMELPGSRRACE